MRLHRRIRLGRRRSGPKKKPKKKIILRVVFVILCAAALTGLSVLLGMYLRERAQFAETLVHETTPDVSAVAEEPEELYPDGILSTSDARNIELCAADIDVTLGSTDSIRNLIGGLSDKYNAISVRVTSEEGELVYVSHALMELVGIDTGAVTQNSASPVSDNSLNDTTVIADDDNPEESNDAGKSSEPSTVLDNLNAALEEAGDRSLRRSAIYVTSPDVLSGGTDAAVIGARDRAVIGELHSLGFDEVIIDGLVGEDDTLSHETLRSIVSYLALLRGGGNGIDIGITLPASVYLISQNASRIKTISEYADLLAIGINSESGTPEEAYSFVYDSCYSLKGNFSVYSIRGVITDRDPKVAAAVCASLCELSVGSVQFSVYVEDPSYSPGESTGSTDAPETGISNDRAMRSEDY